MKIVAGMFAPDAGEMLWRGERVSFRNPAEAQAHGIAMVHQECLLAPHLTVAEDIFLGRQPAGMMGLVNRRSMEQQASQADRGTPFSIASRLDRWETESRSEATCRDLPR